MEKKKIELECEYCGVPITEKDHKCPNCGANCTERIKKYKEQKAVETEEEKQRRIKQSEEIQKAMEAPVKVVFGVAIGIIVLVMIIFFVAIFGARNTTHDVEGTVDAEYQEEAETKTMSCTMDSYELYEYKSDNFPESYNTPEGYQKIAFHVSCTNVSKTDIYISPMDVKLTADDYPVEKANLKTGVFEKAVQGKASYPAITGNSIKSDEKIQGYVGYLVPKDAKTLKFSIKEITITLDNPAYEE
ncbi:MAG: DUF4352 domain-containing protein [Bacilli bacterium]|nr:DUF4352 domain-containing protein [Bacilli bacterium]